MGKKRFALVVTMLLAALVGMILVTSLGASAGDQQQVDRRSGPRWACGAYTFTFSQNGANGTLFVVNGSNSDEPAQSGTLSFQPGGSSTSGINVPAMPKNTGSTQIWSGAIPNGSTGWFFNASLDCDTGGPLTVNTPTFTHTWTPTNTFTPTFTNTFTPTFTHTSTPTNTITPTNTFTPTFTHTWTPSPTNTNTPRPTDSPTNTQQPSQTPFDPPTNMPQETPTEPFSNILGCTVLASGWDPVCAVPVGYNPNDISSEQARVIGSGYTWTTENPVTGASVTFKVPSGCVIVIPNGEGAILLNLGNDQSQLLVPVTSWELSEPNRCMFDRDNLVVHSVAGSTVWTMGLSAGISSPLQLIEATVLFIVENGSSEIIDSVNYSVSSWASLIPAQ